jgi:hypothetical protein
MGISPFTTAEIDEQKREALRRMLKHVLLSLLKDEQ